jgi:hypothetical protein
MNNLRFLILFLPLIIFGCQHPSIDLEELIQKEGVFFEKGNKAPFTGNGVALFSEGEKMMEVPLLNGLPHGISSTWQKNGKLLRQFSYDNGQLFRFATFYKNGNPHLCGEYRDGKTHGKNIFWWENGTKRFDVDFQDGLKHGIEKQWHPNGELALKAEYNHGKKIKATSWDQNGTLIKQEGFK